MNYWSPNRSSAGGLAIDWAVKSFVIVLLFGIVLGVQELWTISFLKGVGMVGAFSATLHGAVIYLFCRPGRRGRGMTGNEGGAVKALEYTISVVCWMLQGVLWWYDALEATSIFLFVPTYFVTSLMTYHCVFEFFLNNRKINKKALFFLAGNFWTLGHSIFILLRARERVQGR